MDRPLVAVMNNDTAMLCGIDTGLRDAGYDPLLLAEGDSAYTAIKRQHPDIVLAHIDSAAPTISWRTLVLLRLDPDTSRIPIVIYAHVEPALKNCLLTPLPEGCVLLDQPMTTQAVLLETRTFFAHAEEMTIDG